MDEVCPRCKTTKYRNPGMKLMVNSCGHALCDNCVDLLFVKGSAACPECNIPLRRTGFRVQLFEDPVVEKEMEIRRKILKDYTKKEGDFSSLREYNDYLEEVETIIFNLVNNIDVTETRRIIDLYRKENEAQILKSRGLIDPTLLELERNLEEERILAEQRHLEITLGEREEKLRKIKTREALIDDLMFSDADAKSIVSSHKANVIAAEAARLEKEKDMRTVRAKLLEESCKNINILGQRVGDSGQFSSGIRIGVGSGGVSGSNLLSSGAEEELYVFKEYDLDMGGPRLPTDTEMAAANYLANVKSSTPQERAGGYNPLYACQRSIKEAFTSIRLRSAETSLALTRNALLSVVNSPAGIEESMMGFS